MSDAVLDPFSTLVRIALLSYLPEGTKIGILNNSILYTPPTLIGKLLRTGMHYIGPGCSRDMMHTLRHPIEHAVCWYPEAKELFEKAKDGLRMLRDTYSDSGNVKDALSLTIAVFDHPKTHIPETSETLIELRKSWSKNEISIIVFMFRQLAEKPNHEYLIDCIVRFVEGKQVFLRQIITRPLVGEVFEDAGEDGMSGRLTKNKKRSTVEKETDTCRPRLDQSTT